MSDKESKDAVMSLMMEIDIAQSVELKKEKRNKISFHQFYNC